jgi:hypothetical protein
MQEGYTHARSRVQARSRRSRKKPADIDTDKIGKLLRLTLSTDKEGEQLAAMSALKRALQKAGLDCHAIADAVERGLKSAESASTPRRRSTSWAPPLPSPDDWQAMAWFCHFHRFQLRSYQQERVADYLLGVAFDESDGQCRRHHLQELQGMVDSISAPW